MKTFENIASLKLATLKEGQFVETGGYYSKGDGGGARYLISTPQAADEYGDHTLANGNVAVLQVHNSVLAEQYGINSSNSDNIAAIIALNSTNLPALFKPETYNISQGFEATNNIDWSCVCGTATIKNTSPPVDTGSPSVDAIINGVLKVVSLDVNLNNIHLSGAHDGATNPGDGGYATKGIVANFVQCSVDIKSTCKFSRGVEYGVRFQECSGTFENIEGFECGFQGVAITNNRDPLTGQLAVGHSCGQNGVDIELSSSFGVGIRDLTINKIIGYSNKNGCSITTGSNSSADLISAGILDTDLKVSIGEIITYDNVEEGTRIDFTEVFIGAVRTYNNGVRGFFLRNANDCYPQRINVGAIYAEDNVGQGVYFDGSTVNPAEYINIGLVDTQRNGSGFFIASSEFTNRIEIDTLYSVGNTSDQGAIPQSNNKATVVSNWINLPQSDGITYLARAQLKPLSNDGATDTNIYLPDGALVTNVYINVTSVDSTAGARWRIKHTSGGTVTISDIRADTLGTRRISLGDKALLGADTDDAPLPFERSRLYPRLIRADPVSTWTGGEAAGSIVVEYHF